MLLSGAKANHLSKPSLCAHQPRKADAVWPNGVRGIPHTIARSALFNVASLRKGERKNYRQREISALNGINLTYTGEELRQDDEDVFLHRLTDSDTKSLRHVRADLKKALGLLVEKEFFLSAVIDSRTDTAQVVRKHCPAE